MAATELVLLRLNTYAGLPQTYEMVHDATVVNRQIKYHYLYCKVLYLRCLQGSWAHIRIKKRRNICPMHTEETLWIIIETL